MSINDWLVFCVVAASAYARSPAALCFCALYILHMALESMMSDAWYYASLILIDSAVAMCVTSIRAPSATTVITGVASGIFLVANIFGLAAWYFYISPASYDAICSVVYIAMMAAFIDEGSNGRLRLAIYRLAGSYPSFSVRKGMDVHHRDGKKI
jgi:hypothetical protein